MQADVLSITGKKTGRTVELPEEIFGIEPNDHVIYLAVKQYLAANRQGTSKVKTRMEVKGSSKKLHRQKGTGGSRKGNIRNPLYKGGGTIFGPKPRDYDFKLNQKVKGLAKCSALSYKAKENSILVLEDVKLDQPKTKDIVSILKGLKAEGKKVLFLTGEDNINLVLSLRNLTNVKGFQFNDMNTYDIVNAQVIVFTEGSVKAIAEEVKEMSAN
ncbi:MAG: 50S ribosomal protein L4 [Chitinophagaceae bacterium]